MVVVVVVVVVVVQVILDEAAEVPPPDPVIDGGPDPAARRNAFLELALWLSYGLPDGAVDVLFKVQEPLALRLLCLLCLIILPNVAV